MRDPLTPVQDYIEHAAARRIIVGVLLAMLLAALDQVMVATALPTIAASLADVENMSWVVTANLLSATAVTPLYGKLSDIHGRRTMMLIAKNRANGIVRTRSATGSVIGSAVSGIRPGPPTKSVEPSAGSWH